MNADDITLLFYLYTFVAVVVSIFIASALEKRLKARTPATRPYRWGFYVGCMGVACAPVAPLGVLAMFLATMNSQWVGFALILVCTVYFTIVAVSGWFIIQRKRWAWVVGTIASLNPLWWIINGIYAKNRWQEFVGEPYGSAGTEDEGYALLADATNLEVQGRVQEAIAAYQGIADRYSHTAAGQDAQKSIENLRAKVDVNIQSDKDGEQVKLSHEQPMKYMVKRPDETGEFSCMATLEDIKTGLSSGKIKADWSVKRASGGGDDWITVDRLIYDSPYPKAPSNASTKPVSPSAHPVKRTKEAKLIIAALAVFILIIGLAVLFELAVAMQSSAQRPATNAAGTNAAQPYDLLDQVAAEQAATNKPRLLTDAEVGLVPDWARSSSSTNATSKTATTVFDQFDTAQQPTNSPPQSARQIAQNSFPSVVLLVMEDANGQPIALGSGFFVRENVIASNFHVVEGASSGYAKLIGAKTKYDIAGLAGVDTVHDLVLLNVNGAISPALPLADSRQAAVGDEVFAVGNPQGLEGTFSQGIVSSIRDVESETLLQITAPISPGSSGGPVLNSAGKVIGISVATFNGGQNLNFAIPANYLASLLVASNTNRVTPLGLDVTTQRGKSILDDLGGQSTEGVKGGQLTWENELWTYGNFSFTLQNKLRDSVKNVYCLVIFYDRNDSPVDIAVIHYPGTIPGGLGKRVTGDVDPSVKRLTTDTSSENQYENSLTPATKIEFRVLDFEIDE